jgi:Dihydrofolate reductase
MANERVIGVNNGLPWDLPADMKHFRELTLGKPIIMGRKTYESIGRPLPGRRNIVVSRNSELKIPGVDVVSTLDDAISMVSNVQEIMIVGGAQLYADALSKANKIYLTKINLDIKGDSFFPQFNESEWTVLQKDDFECNELNKIDFSFIVLEKKNNIM